MLKVLFITYLIMIKKESTPPGLDRTSQVLISLWLQTVFRYLPITSNKYDGVTTSYAYLLVMLEPKAPTTNTATQISRGESEVAASGCWHDSVAVTLN